MFSFSLPVTGCSSESPYCIFPVPHVQLSLLGQCWGLKEQQFKNKCVSVGSRKKKSSFLLFSGLLLRFKQLNKIGFGEYQWITNVLINLGIIFLTITVSVLVFKFQMYLSNTSRSLWLYYHLITWAVYEQVKTDISKFTTRVDFIFSAVSKKLQICPSYSQRLNIHLRF